MPHFSNDIINVVGTYYTLVYSDARLIDLIQIGKEVILIREPRNPHDANAVGVYLPDEESRYGYIPRKIAARLAPILDRGSRYDCSVREIRGRKSEPKIVISLTTWPVPVDKPRLQPKSPIDPPQIPSPHPETPTGEPFRKIIDFDSHCKQYMGFSGVYVIWNRHNKCYVGNSIDVGRRWKKHWDKLLSRSHENSGLQNDWVQMGAREFRFDLLEESDPGRLAEREEFFIRQLSSYTDGYNTTPDGQGIPSIFQVPLHGGNAPPEPVTSDENTPPVFQTPPSPPKPEFLPRKNIQPPERPTVIHFISGILAFLTIVVLAAVLLPQFEADRERSATSTKQVGKIMSVPRKEPTEGGSATGEQQVIHRQDQTLIHVLEKVPPTSMRQPQHQLKRVKKGSKQERGSEEKVLVLGDTVNYRSITIRTYEDGSYLVAYYDKDGNKHMSNSRKYLLAEIIEALDKMNKGVAPLPKGE